MNTWRSWLASLLLVSGVAVIAAAEARDYSWWVFVLGGVLLAHVPDLIITEARRRQ